MKRFTPLWIAAALATTACTADTDPRSLALSIEDKVIDWRHDIHQNPELSNREFRTAEVIANHLNSLPGMVVETGVAHTGVVGILDTGKPGPVIALRADIDALPVLEQTGLPFASTATGEYNGETVPVMHACGHDTHVAMLMGAAELLAENTDQFTGKVVFLFQPAEEGAPHGEEGGAYLMVKEGVLERHGVESAFAIHISSGTESGVIEYKERGIMASSQSFKLTVSGQQVHGAYPWGGVDPIVASAQLIDQLQTIVSRELPLTTAGAVVTVGSIHGGVRSNIIPETVEMLGTIRTLDNSMRDHIHEAMYRKVDAIAAATRTNIELELPYGTDYPITYNDPELTRAVVPIAQRAAGADNVRERLAVTGAEDFSFFQEKVPGVYFFLGGRDPEISESEAPAHHTPFFRVEDDSMKTGVELFYRLVTEYPQ